MKLEEVGTRNRRIAAEVSLVQLSADGVTVAWPEAVAIISQICRCLIASGTHAFDPSTIVIQPTGDVVLGTSTSGDAEQSVHALGEWLRTCLLGMSHPTPLQIIVAQATCRPPFYQSIAELAEALSYYSASKPQEITRALYERWRSDHPVPVPAPVAVPVRVRPPVVRSVRATILSLYTSLYTARPKWMTQRVLAITTAILFCSGVAGIAFAAGLGRSAAPALVAKISRANGQATAALVSRMGGVVELLRIRFTPTASKPANRTADSQASHSTRRRRAVQPVSRTAAELRVAPAPSDISPGDAAATPRSWVPAVELVAPFADLSRALSSETAAVTPRHWPDPLVPNELRVYSAEDTDVSAPIAIDRIQPHHLAAFSRNQNVVAITIVVSEDGRVESATLATRPQTFHDSVVATLNLTAVKAWRFHPALRTGRPVKYRTTVWLADK